MDEKRATEILEVLADGVDPFTGEIFPPDSPYQNPEIIRALFIATKKLKDSKPNPEMTLEKTPEVTFEKTMGKPKSVIGNAGKAWSSKEDEELENEFKENLNLKEIAKRHNRTRGAISSRLIKKGLIRP